MGILQCGCNDNIAKNQENYHSPLKKRLLLNNYEIPNKGCLRLSIKNQEDQFD